MWHLPDPLRGIDRPERVAVTSSEGDTIGERLYKIAAFDDECRGVESNVRKSFLFPVGVSLDSHNQLLLLCG